MQLPTLNESFSPHSAEIMSRQRRGVYWSAIFGGAVAATAVSILLTTLGVGLGFASMSPWYDMGPSAQAITMAAAIWMLVTQWLASGLGGYLAGRLRNRWHGFHADEGYFRDTVHGFLTWSIATILVAVIVSSAAAHMHRNAGTVEMREFREERTAMAPVDHNFSANDVAREEARNKIISEFALFTAVAMLVGAFIASAGAALGGIHRDEYDAKL